jgi:hypothetical protein
MRRNHHGHVYAVERGAHADLWSSMETRRVDTSAPAHLALLYLAGRVVVG